MSPPGPRVTTALLARVWPGLQFIVETSGSVEPAAKARMSPAAVGLVTVKLKTIASAVAGTPHLPPTWNVRSAPAASDGAPHAPAGPRVSIRRQGVVVWNCAEIGRQAENSEVLPLGSVAVAVMMPRVTTGYVTSIVALQDASVVTMVELKNVLP